MAKKGERKSKLLGEAIDASIEFEELMDKTDFDSWLDSDEPGALEKLGQEVAPFNKFKKNENILNRICEQMKQRGNNEINDSEEKSQIEKRPIYNLFEAKNKRLDARICTEKGDEQEKYKEALPYLLSALNKHDKFCLQMKQNESNKSLNPGEDNAFNRWLILFYNDLSICYAGLENSSMSRGYAEEAKKIIEKEETYKEFEKIFEEFEKKLDSTTLTRISNCDFVSSKLYDLYTIALFNQALAEKRSYSYSEAEKNFKKIIKYTEEKTKDNKITPLCNFNYYSALLNLGDLYIDLGRGKEAVELLDKAINKLDENDIRYWNASIAKINALIDQSEYLKAKKLLSKFFKEEDGFTLCERHRVTSTGFKGLNCFMRCIIENARNDLKRNDKKKEGELKQAVKVINDNIKIMRKRNQKGSETKAYKQLSDIYKILSQDKEDKDISEYDEKVIDNLIKFISEADSKAEKIDNLNKFISDHLTDMGKWIDECDDLDVLESFTDQIIKVTENKLIDKYIDLLEKLKKKIIKECDDKNQLSRAERIVREIDKVLGKKNIYDAIYIKNIFSEESSRGNKKGLVKVEIRTRLDINEKEFDSAFFERSKIKNDNHIVEMIVLRRWNSFSPGLYRESTGSLGGGYLLRIKRKNKYLMEGNDGVKKKENEKVVNIVIDPGYNFVQNFRREGFYIDDIDTIIVTHSHLDHCAELLPIMDLMYQFNKRYKYTPNEKRQRKKVNLCLSQGAYKKFSSYIDDPDWKMQLKDVIILENLGKKKWEPFKGLTISAIPTPHMDLGGVKAIGLKIEIDREKKLCLGFTGDTPWDPKIKKHFKGCDILCVHLGGIKYQEIGYTDDRYNQIKKKPGKIPSKEKQKKFNETYAAANHLLFFGTLDFIKDCTNKGENNLIIVGEFGEELKYGLRTDLCKKLYKEANKKRKKKKKIVCLPGDIGLYIGIDKYGTKKVCCNFCEEFVEQEEIETFSYGREDAIHYICKTCNNTLSEIQKQAFIEHRVTKH
ncbi:MAG: MBL fold metallo-hydrolase [Candidatus Atribacteria bacterium]